MMDKNNNAVWEKYSKTTHFIGRFVSAITVIMLVGAPFLIGKYLGAFPDIGAVGKAFFSVGLVWTVSLRNFSSTPLCSARAVVILHLLPVIL